MSTETRARFAATLSAELLLCVAATMLAAAPWLRAFPASVAAAVLLGAAALSVLLPGFTRERPLGVSIVVSAAGFALFSLLVVLREPSGFADLRDGLVHGPSQLLTFALPLISPRTLLVDPVALTWLAGTVAGIAVTRRWSATLPALALLGAFGLSYAATQRAAGPNGIAVQTWLGAGLLGCVLALRAVQTWRDQSATGPRALTASGTAAVAVTVVAALLVQGAFFGKQAASVQRTPTVHDTTPLSPLAFVAGLRPDTTGNTGVPAFTVQTSVSTTGYVSLANVDTYDGAGWTFVRTFRPSGGVMPADADSTVPDGRPVAQTYRIAAGPLVAGPWMPYLERPARVTGVAVNIDASSGMIVPSRGLRSGIDYGVTSTQPLTTFDHLDAAALTPDTATPATDVQLPATLRATLDSIVSALSTETGVTSSSPLVFLQALQRDFRTHYALAAPTPAGTSSPSAAPATAAGTAQRAGGTGFADVLASILGAQRTATPEQYATLTALLARDLGVPARVVTGFRIPLAPGAKVVAAGQHVVRTSQAWTWTEVAISGVGWVVLDPSPTTFRTPAGDQASGAAEPTPPTAVPTNNALVTTGNGGNAVAHPSKVPHGTSRTAQLLLVVLLAIFGAVLLGGLLMLSLRKGLRARRRHRRAEAAARISGAWEETIDRFYEAGLAPAGALDALTSCEINELVRARFADPVVEHSTAIGEAAETVAFATAVLVREEDADFAWQQQRELRHALTRRLTWRERVGAFVSYHRNRDHGARSLPHRRRH